MSTVLHAAGIIVFARTTPLRFLLLKHQDRWDLPKGHARPHEESVQTALRETQEETGISPDDIQLDESFRFEIEYEIVHRRHGRCRKHVIYFLGWIDDARDIQLTEHIGYSWFTWPAGPVQAETIDPLLTAVAQHFTARPQ